MSDEQPFDDVLAEALRGRASEVSATPSDEARSAVEQRIRQRARARRQRRVLVSATSAVAAVLVVVIGAVALVGDDGPDVAVGTHDSTTSTGAPLVLRPGESAHDPADFGLPRIGFAEALDLRAQNVAPEEVSTATVERDFFDFTQIQSFRPRGQAVPVIFAPWPAPPPDAPADGDRPVRVGDTDGTLHGEELGWLRLTWPLPDGTDARLWAYGVPSQTLVDFAADLRVEADGVGYEPGSMPDGFFGETAPAPPADAVAAQYELEFRSSDARLSVTLTVNSDTREEQDERLIVALMSQTTGHDRKVMGEPGIVLDYPDGSWMVAWPPADGVTALLRLTGTTDRAEVEAIVDGLQALSAEEWDAALAAG